MCWQDGSGCNFGYQGDYQNDFTTIMAYNGRAFEQNDYSFNTNSNPDVTCLGTRI